MGVSPGRLSSPGSDWYCGSYNLATQTIVSRERNSWTAIIGSLQPFPLIPPNRWNPQQNAAAGPSSLPISTESKADVKDLQLWASNLASQINTEVAGASEGLADWVRELQTTFGEVKTGLAGALGIGGQVDPFDEPDWGAERDRPVNAA